jgi:hypothetical protein
MSYDDYEVEYHLTPTGWKRGTSYYYGKTQQEIEPPSDRVLTVVKEVTQSSGWSREEVSWGTKWKSNETPSDAVDALVAKFGELPQ